MLPFNVAAASLLTTVATLLVASLPSASASLQSCLQSNGVNYLDSNSGSSWTSAKTPFNKRLQGFTPVAIAYPTSAQQVSATVLCGLNNYVYINARGGGHSYAFSASGGESGHLMVDMSKLNSITLSGTNAIIGGGARLGDVGLALSKQGRALPNGVCPWVGVGGHATGGGYGTHSSRAWGLLMDRLVSMQMVTAEGTVRNISASSANSDLFWAMRGAGQSYGIVVSFTFATVPAPSNLVVAKYTWNSLSTSQAASMFNVYQTHVSSAIDSNWGSVMNVFKGPNAGSIKVILQATYIGDQNTFTNMAQPLLSKLPGTSNTNVQSYNWVNGLQALAGNQNLNTQNGAKDYTDTFYAKSIMTPEAAPVSTSAWNSFANYLANSGYYSDTAWFVQIELYGGPGSAINKPGRTDTAFVHRSSLLTLQLYASSSNYGPPYPSDGINFLGNMAGTIINSMGSSWKYEAYQNYPDTQFTAAQAQQLIWIENYSTLQTIKAKYDPRRVFKVPPYLGIVAN